MLTILWKNYINIFIAYLVIQKCIFGNIIKPDTQPRTVNFESN